MQIKYINYLLLVTTLSSLIVACGVGSSSGNSGDSSNPAHSSGINSLTSIDSMLNTKYTANCIYKYGNEVILVNGDGGGTGVGIDVTTGNITNQTGLPKINITNGDACLPNFYQLTWLNTKTPTTFNVFDPMIQSTNTVDLSQTGITGSSITTTSFDWDSASNSLFANNTFLNNGYFGFSSFNLTTPIATYQNLDNSTYYRQGTHVLYGFWGLGSEFSQMYPANTTTNSPALFVIDTVVGHGNPIQQQVNTITDSNNQIIPAMVAAWDITNVGTDMLITTGEVQPLFYRCSRSTSIQNNFACSKTYTDSSLLSKYRILRLLGGTSTTLYFVGINLTKNTIDIFSMGL